MIKDIGVALMYIGLCLVFTHNIGLSLIIGILAGNLSYLARKAILHD